MLTLMGHKREGAWYQWWRKATAAQRLQLCQLCSILRTAAHQAPLFMGSPGNNTGVGCHALLQGIFPTQGLNPDLLHCRQILYR